MPELSEVARAFYDQFPQPHPETGRPMSVTVGEWPTMVRLANHTKFGAEGKHASPEEVEGFHKEFKELEMEPEDYEHLLDDMARVSFTYHGRPPTMKEIGRHKDAKPNEIRDYYKNLPHKDYPQITAGEMVSSLEKARFYSNYHLGRDPHANEAMMFHHTTAGAQAIDQHYAKMKDLSDVSDNGIGSQSGGPGAQAPRQFQFGAPLAPPDPPASRTPTQPWHAGVPAGGAPGAAGDETKDRA